MCCLFCWPFTCYLTEGGGYTIHLSLSVMQFLASCFNCFVCAFRMLGSCTWEASWNGCLCFERNKSVLWFFSTCFMKILLRIMYMPTYKVHFPVRPILTVNYILQKRLYCPDIISDQCHDSSYIIEI